MVGYLIDYQGLVTVLFLLNFWTAIARFSILLGTFTKILGRPCLFLTVELGSLVTTELHLLGPIIVGIFISY